MRVVCGAVLVLLAAGGSARADLVVTTEKKVMRSEPPAVETQRLTMTADKLASTATRPEGGETRVIFRGDKGVVWALDPAAKSYMELDKASMTALSGQASEAMKQVQDKLAQLPPEQRAMAEKMMQGQVPGMQAPAASTLEVQATGEKKTLQGFTCTRYDILIGGTKRSEFWVASWSEAKVDKEDLAALRAMTKFFEELMQANPMLRNVSAGSTYQGMDRIDGFPVQVRHFDGGKVVDETTLKSIAHEPVDASAYEVPAGYTRKSIGPRG